MKAVVFYGPGDMRIEEREIPQPSEQEVLIKMKACAICGTDVRIYSFGQANVKPPQIIGHEIAGVVSQVGSKIKGCREGDKITLVTAVGCGKCRYCLEGRVNLCHHIKPIGYYYSGGFAEYMIVPAEAIRQGSILKIPKGLSFNEASLAEPLSCCINGQEYLNIGLGDRVVIVGTGPIGCMHAELAKVSGATKIILADISAERLKLAKVVEADVYINSEKEDLVKRVLEETQGDGADVVITACPSPQVQAQSLSMTAIRGRICFFGGLPHGKSRIDFDSNIIHYREISVHGAFASHHSQYQKALDLFVSGRIKASKFITHQFPLKDLVKGIETIKEGKALKAVVVMN